MPHLVILYTPRLDTEVEFDALCRGLADTMLQCRDESNQPVFPIGGVRVLAFPAAHAAVSDGGGDYGFIYLNLRIGRGRSDAVKKAVGEALAATANRHLAPLLARCVVGITLQIDEGNPVFDARFGNLHTHLASRGA